ncbi:hypothetical protein HYPSUDRAFT_92035 [Hypholoma sublateritium FD-334 SS-4]|uniref:Post-SET domain-containing protein n=1 Tax=Hypholoma sublateritium (strain FD-334 SS-4) TaxID=945553 RepID=A0A0D2N843_HYPSF|nr:hypothetical protein HYPSUDRAFT_92035 [Hypholoma sublateritium FD-334 SS-4]
MPKPSRKSYVPTHPTKFVVEFAPGEFSSYLKSLKAFTAGQVMCTLRGLTHGAKAYTSVQCGRGAHDHIELNSDLVYINHSCEPNVAFDLSSTDRAKWHLRALKDIKRGEPLTFFYPSTEWDMDQRFKCECGTPTCVGSIQGAKYLSRKELQARGFVSPWIQELVSERDNKTPERAVSRL